jgi:chromate reductase, NAD(P)H dehydrogenase (quinone)
MPKILAFAGSLREGSLNKKVLAVAVEGAKATGGVITVVDLRDYPMPLYNADEHERNGFDANALEFQELLCEHQGLLIASPEYNGSIPGGMKNVIDWTSRKSERYERCEPFRGKHAAMITASPGSFGGIRCLSHLRGVLSIIGVTVLPSEIAVTFASQKFDADGRMKDEATRALLEALGASLVDTLRRMHGEAPFVSDTQS